MKVDSVSSKKGVSCSLRIFENVLSKHTDWTIIFLDSTNRFPFVQKANSSSLCILWRYGISNAAIYGSCQRGS